MTTRIDDAVRDAFATDENRTPLSEVIRMGRSRRRRRIGLTSVVAALALIGAGLLAPWGDRANRVEPTGLSPAEVRAIDTRCRVNIVPSGAALALAMGDKSEFLLLYTQGQHLFECESHGPSINGTDHAFVGGPYAVSLGPHRSAVFGSVIPDVTSVDIGLNGVNRHATLAHGAYAGLVDGGPPAGNDILIVTEHVAEGAYLSATTGIPADVSGTDSAAIGLDCLMTTRALLAAAPGVPANRRASPVEVIGSVVRPDLWMAVVAGEGALATCEPGQTSMWVTAGPFATSKDLGDVYPVRSFDRYGRAAGHAPDGTTSVDVILSDGTIVPATVRNGFYLATWVQVGTVSAARIEAATPSGVVTLPLG